jgi:hypothetical protein
MKRPTQDGVLKGSRATFTDQKFATEYPTLTDWMVDDKWDDGKPRAVSTISINFSQGSVTVGLSDHAFQRSAYTTADTLAEALDLLEAALAGERIGWRRWKQQQPKK